MQINYTENYTKIKLTSPMQVEGWVDDVAAYSSPIPSPQSNGKPSKHA